MFRKHRQSGQYFQPATDNMFVASGGASSKSKRLLRLFIVLAIVGLVVLIGVFVFRTASNNPKNVATKFLTQTAKGEADKSYALTSKSFGLNLGKDEWSKKVDIYHLLFTKDLKHTASEVKTDEDGQKFNQETFSIVGDDSSYVVLVFLTSEDGKWQVNKMSVAQADQ